MFKTPVTPVPESFASRSTPRIVSGWSGPDGIGVAVRALLAMLRDDGIDAVLRQYGDIRKK